jgi:hypothetical protein
VSDICPSGLDAFDTGFELDRFELHWLTVLPAGGA